MTRRARTTRIIESAAAILREHQPMTVRQLFYQLVSRQVEVNDRGTYQAVSKALIDARQAGEIPWAWIEDRTRRPRQVPMWTDPAEFADCAARSYRRNVWNTQPAYVEIWLEKDALSGIFEEVLEPYGVTLNVGRGFDGWSSIHGAAERYDRQRRCTVLYFGDNDPSGEAMVESLALRLGFFSIRPEIVKVAINADDIDRYGLPPDFTKPSDSRSKRFIAEHGNQTVELDALPVEVLRERICGEVEARMDLDALAAVRVVEESEREQIRSAMRGAP